MMYQYLIFVSVLLLMGCTTKAYFGPEVPIEQLATINVDWFQTRWSDEIKVADEDMHFFKTVEVLPGKVRVSSKSDQIFYQQQIGYSRCSVTKSEHKDAKGKEYIDEHKICNTPYLVDANHKLCQINFSVVAGQHYDAYTQNGYLYLLNSNNLQIENSICKDYQTSQIQENTTSDYISYPEHK
ncbi:hypothetical protein [Methylomonas sp. AM2-LC]|uniref:hypothetical protein n=1 Tax=Methylomonas sp. AM2-LC TaxID=3153301 RepID=UPI0032652DA7